MKHIVHTHSRESNWKSFCNHNNGYVDKLWDLEENSDFVTLNKYPMKFELP